MRTCENITRDDCVRLVASNQEHFAHYKHISYFFNKYSLSLYVYTRGLLGCLFGFFRPLGQNLALATIILKGKKELFLEATFLMLRSALNYFISQMSLVHFAIRNHKIVVIDVFKKR